MYTKDATGRPHWWPQPPWYCPRCRAATLLGGTITREVQAMPPAERPRQWERYLLVTGWQCSAVMCHGGLTSRASSEPAGAR